MSQTAASMNFLPEDYVEKRQAARTAVICIGLLVVVVSGIMGAWVYKQWEAKPTFAKQTQVDTEFDEMSKQIHEAQELRDEKGKMQAKAELATTLMERVKRSALLAELTTLQPKAVKMLSLDLKSRELPQAQISDMEKAKRIQDGLPPIEAKPPELEVTLDLIGTAPSDGEVAAYIAALGKSPLLSEVNLLFSDEFKRQQGESQEVVRKFHVEMKVNPAADLRRMNDAPMVSDAIGN